MILISKCFAVWTYDDLDAGESSDSGFEFQDVEYSFKELVDLMKDYNQGSSSTMNSARDWISYIDQDYIEGEQTEYTLHYSHNNKPRSAKYWFKALKVAGFTK